MIWNFLYVTLSSFLSLPSTLLAHCSSFCPCVYINMCMCHTYALRTHRAYIWYLYMYIEKSDRSINFIYYTYKYIYIHIMWHVCREKRCFMYFKTYVEVDFKSNFVWHKNFCNQLIWVFSKVIGNEYCEKHESQVIFLQNKYNVTERCIVKLFDMYCLKLMYY